MKTLKTLFYVLLAVVILIVVLRLLSVAVGLLFTIAFLGIAVAIVAALIRHAVESHKERRDPHIRHKRAEKAADRALKEMEREVNKQ